VRVFKVNNKLWFVTKDLANIFDCDLSKGTQGVVAHLPSKWKSFEPIKIKNGFQNASVISEEGLAFFLSKLPHPSVGEFETWVNSAVRSFFQDTDSAEIPVEGKELIPSPQTNLSIFQFNKLDVRVVYENGEVWCVGKDVARVLGYADETNALKQHCRGVVKRHPIVDALGRTQEVRVIAEPDVYRLIIKSRLPEAEKFERWVFEDVIPTIRKHGGYLTPAKLEEALLNPDVLIKLATNLKEEQLKRKAAEETIEHNRPKVKFADAVSGSPTSILVGDLAKLLKQNGCDTGQTRLFNRLRKEGYLIKADNSSWNMPTQKAMDLGLFEIRETVVQHSNGKDTIEKTPRVTGKGQIYFINKFLTSE
jgi:anti-repressor protein